MTSYFGNFLLVNIRNLDVVWATFSQHEYKQVTVLTVYCYQHESGVAWERELVDQVVF